MSFRFHSSSRSFCHSFQTSSKPKFHFTTYVQYSKEWFDSIQTTRSITCPLCNCSSSSYENGRRQTRTFLAVLLVDAETLTGTNRSMRLCSTVFLWRRGLLLLLCPDRHCQLTNETSVFCTIKALPSAKEYQKDTGLASERNQRNAGRYRRNLAGVCRRA